MAQQRTMHWEISRRYREDLDQNWSFWTIIDDAHLMHDEGYFYEYQDSELPNGYYEYRVYNPKFEEEQTGSILLLLVGEIFSPVATSNAETITGVNIPLVNLELLSVFPKNISFTQPNEQVQLKWSVYPPESTNKSVTWRSEDPDVAVVNSEGLVSAVGNGRTFIAGTTHEGISDQCEVEVSLVPQKLFLYPSSLVLEKDSMFMINIATYPSLQVYSDITINWKTNDYTKASVVSKGLKALVRAHNIGHVEITANIEGTDTTETCQVIIKNHSIIRVDNSKAIGEGLTPSLEVVNNE